MEDDRIKRKRRPQLGSYLLLRLLRLLLLLCQVLPGLPTLQLQHLSPHRQGHTPLHLSQLQLIMFP